MFIITNNFACSKISNCHVIAAILYEIKRVFICFIEIITLQGFLLLLLSLHREGNGAMPDYYLLRSLEFKLAIADEHLQKVGIVSFWITHILYVNQSIVI